MERPSGHGFDSDEGDPDMQAESDGELERMEDDCPKNLDLCVRNEDIGEQSAGKFSMNGEVVEPYVGMAFNSRDEAKDFYIAYGRRIGFTVRIHHNRRSRVNNQVIGQDFVCSKEGFRAKKYVYRKDRVLPPPPITREGCQAMIRLAFRDGEKWIVTKFVKEHNHKLMSPGKVPWRGSGKHLMSEDEKDKRIRELSLELYNERQKCKRRCAAYEEQLNTILRDLEKHTEHISKKVADVVQSIREIEEEQSEDTDRPITNKLLPKPPTEDESMSRTFSCSRSNRNMFWQVL
ncbi:protein FAR-RED ELONGATED HYPOCOTYL 3-like isoform X2 [Malania oleifera]|uniref:protein FAR-RED ELONGATED HYPOCOTYL 3-like isoform X2 n=1 Tax=Malania oleifera TaxID=397392 RepID=UPI0025ADBCFA|nr:protein FAR-RED ELONGATED HYPOCOTYL 3-like isoform X2 [Malania oleifera]